MPARGATAGVDVRCGCWSAAGSLEHLPRMGHCTRIRISKGIFSAPRERPGARAVVLGGYAVSSGCPRLHALAEMLGSRTVSLPGSAAVGDTAGTMSGYRGEGDMTINGTNCCANAQCAGLSMIVSVSQKTTLSEIRRNGRTRR